MQTAVSTVPGGLETPDFLQLRKDTGPAESEVSATPVPRELYQVIPERQTSSRGFMGSSTTYDVGSLGGGPSGGPRVLGDDRGTKVSSAVTLLEGLSKSDFNSLCITCSAKLELRWLSTLTTWKGSLRRNSGLDTTPAKLRAIGCTYREQMWTGESLTMSSHRPRSLGRASEVGVETDGRRRSLSFERRMLFFHFVSSDHIFVS